HGESFFGSCAEWRCSCGFALTKVRFFPALHAVSLQSCGRTGISAGIVKAAKSPLEARLLIKSGCSLNIVFVIIFELLLLHRNFRGEPHDVFPAVVRYGRHGGTGRPPRFGTVRCIPVRIPTPPGYGAAGLIRLSRKEREEDGTGGGPGCAAAQGYFRSAS